MHSYICIVAFHLGTIDVPREGCDVEAEAGPGEAQVNFTDAVENPIPTQKPLTNTDLVLIPGKPRSMSSLF